MTKWRLVTPPIAIAVGVVAAVLSWPVAAGAGAELPSAIAGNWTKQPGAATSNPGRVTFARVTAAIDGEECTLGNLRAVQIARWYADFSCGRAGGSEPVWLDINLIDAGRIMINRRPLAEADIYARGALAVPSSRSTE